MAPDLIILEEEKKKVIKLSSTELIFEQRKKVLPNYRLSQRSGQCCKVPVPYSNKERL